MLEVKYYKDYRHNYLIVKDNGSLEENVYQRKMITENKIKGLLLASERHINGELLLYYEITSKQSLQSFFDGKNIKMEHLKKFFVQLKVVNDNLQKFLLDGSCLVLSPQYVFQNVETGDFSFLYYPDPEVGSLEELMDFFVTKVDSEDMEAVEAVYKIADLIQKEQFVLDEVLKWFQDDLEEKKKDCSQKGYENFDEEENTYLKDIPDNGKREESSDKRIIRIVPAVSISALGAGILIYAMLFYQLSYKEAIYIIAGWGVIVMILLCTAVWYFKPKLFNGKKEKNTYIQEDAERFIKTCEADGSELSEDVGNTVFIPWTESYENKLYGMDRKNKYHIDLRRLPLTVGKLAGAVDMVIDEQSISRMHARFTKAGSSVYITDLNSTNGTFRNGMRLDPNTSELIEPGDEIRLGKLKFIYR